MELPLRRRMVLPKRPLGLYSTNPSSPFFLYII
ncbi:hypothetical protein ABH894_001606 [Paenibacillus sp. RC62]